MKKLFVIILVLCLAFAGVAGYLSYNGDSSGVSRPAVTAAPTEEPEADDYADSGDGIVVDGGESAGQSLDLEALYALHAPEDVVLTVDGRDVTWDQYFYLLSYQAVQIENYFLTMSVYYGMEQTWTDMLDENQTYAAYVPVYVEDSLREMYSIEGFAAANGVALTAEAEAELQAQRQQDITDLCGEGATEADFEAYLAGLNMSVDTYDWLNRVSTLYQQGYTQLYGENGELYDADAAIAWLADNGYVAAHHILLMTVDPASGEALDEGAKAEKLSQIQALLDELNAIEDPTARLARFEELKAEYCEDTGKTAYPHGYTFTPGTMVAEFEDAVNAMGDYELSGVVETSYGYHIIMRLPLRTDGLTMDRDSNGLPMTGRALASSAIFDDRLQAYFDAIPVTYAPGFEPVNVSDYLA